MTRQYYYVVKSGSGWQVKIEGSKVSLHEATTQAGAMAYATESARALWERHGRPSGVRMQGRDGQWQDERTYGNDPHPPRG